MTAEQQLERSVLEGKERDELHAIAQALSVKTNTRTKKADIIDGILKATGVAVDDSVPGATVAGNGSGSNGSEANGRRPARSTRATAASDDAPGEKGTTDGSAEPGERAGGRRPARRPVAAQSFGPSDDVDSTGESVDLGDEEFGGTTSVDTRTEHRGSNGSGDDGGSSAPAVEGGESHPAGDGGRQGATGGQNNQNNQNNRSQNTQGNRNQGNRNQGNQGNRNQGNRNQGGGNDDVGNRRSNRRRRGRDRQGGGDGDLQGSGGQDQQYQGELDPGEGPARPPRRGLRLPALRGVPAFLEGRLRLDQPGPAVRAPQGGQRRGVLPTGGEHGEIPGPAPDRHGLDAWTPRWPAIVPGSRT